MQRARAAKRHERKITRICSLLDGDDAHRSHHVGVDDVEHTRRHSDVIELEFVA
jgi:hypothetical protein